MALVAVCLVVPASIACSTGIIVVFVGTVFLVDFLLWSPCFEPYFAAARSEAITITSVAISGESFRRVSPSPSSRSILVIGTVLDVWAACKRIDGRQNVCPHRRPGRINGLVHVRENRGRSERGGLNERRESERKGKGKIRDVSFRR